MHNSTIALLVAAAFAPAALANPTGAQVVNGAALLSNPNATTLQIVNTPGAIINWQGFSIAGGETTRFVQLNAASAVLNRVVTANPSSILGNLQSNGRVFLINPNGIVFGSGAVVDVAGLIASTRDISNANFLAGNFLFDGPGNGAITLQSGAQILTSTHGPGGQVWLIGQSIEQQAGSSITAPQGQVVLAAGSQVQVGASNLGNMTFTVNVNGGETIELLGAIAAERGAVGLFADTVRVRDGGSVNVSAGASGNGGSISVHARTLLEVERLADLASDGGTSSGNGGTISLAAADVRVSPVANAYGNVHASPRAAGGQHGTVTVNQTGVPGLTQIANVSIGEAAAVSHFGVADVAALADGSYVVVWAPFLSDGASSNRILAKRVSANGSPIGGSTTIAAFAPNTTGSSGGTVFVEGPRVAALKDGGYVVTWMTANRVSSGCCGVYELDMMIVGPTGQTSGRINLSTTPDSVFAGTDIAALTNGGFVVAWNAFSTTFPSTLVQRFNASGSAAGPAQNMGIVSFSINERPQVAGLSDGGYVLYSGVGSTLGFLRFDRGGQLIASSAGGTSSANSGVSGLVGGGYALGRGAGVAGSVQRFSANGDPLGSAIPSLGASAIPPSVFAGVNTIVASVAGTADGGAIGDHGFVETLAATRDGGHAAAYLTGSDARSLNLRILARQAVASSAGPVSGGAGANASFATRPGVTPEVVPVAPDTPTPGVTPPPPVVTGNPGGGASFGGISGCNSAVCSEQVRTALALIGAERVSELMTQGASDSQILTGAQQARDAVQALQATFGTQGAAVVARDYGEMARLIETMSARWAELGAADIAQEQLIFESVWQTFVERERRMQDLGVYRIEPNEMTLGTMIENMNAKDRIDFMKNVAANVSTAP